MDNRIAENIKYFQQIIDWINNEYFDNQVGIIVVPGHYSFTKTPKVEIKNGRINTFVYVDFYSGNINKNECVKSLFHQVIMIYSELLPKPDYQSYNFGISSNRGMYLNYRYARLINYLGGTVKKHEKYGYRINELPKNLQEYLNTINFNNFNIYIPEENKASKSSTRKYICPCCGNSFRATKDLNVLCMDCNEQYIKIKR